MGKALRKIFIIVSLSCFILLVIMNLYIYVRNLAFLYIIPYLVVLPALFLVGRKLDISKVNFSLMLFLLSFLSKAIASFFFDTPLNSDFKLFYDAAVMASQGDFSFSESGYFNIWGYQTGIVLLYALVIKILGPGLISIKLINCLFMAGTNLIVYLISEKVCDDKTARFISLVYMIYPAPYFLASVLTNQHASNFFLYSGLYIFIKKNRNTVSTALLSAFLLALGNALRPHGIVVIAAIILFGILGQPKKPLFLYIIILVASYFLFGQAFSLSVKAAGINENGLKNMFPSYKLVVGLNHETSGQYSGNDVTALMSVADMEKRNEKAFEMIRERLTHPKRLIRLLFSKQKIMWGDFDQSFTWGFGYLEKEGINLFNKNISYSIFGDILKKSEKQIYLLVFLFASVGVFSLLRSGMYNETILLLTMVVMFNIGIYSLIEIQPRYRDFTMVAVFIIAAKGLEYVSGLLNKKQTDSESPELVSSWN